MTRKQYRRRSKMRVPYRKGRKLVGYRLTNFIYPHLVFASFVFWIMALVFLWGAQIGPEILRQALWAVAGLSAWMAIIFSIQCHRHRQLLNRAVTISYLRKLDPMMFEHYIANLLRRHGYKQVRVRGGAGDRGIDIATLKNGEKVVIQCKRYAANHKVTSPELQRFIGAIQIAQAARGLFVATSTYTAEAKAIAAGSGVALVGETELAAMINQAFAPAGEPMIRRQCQRQFR